MDMGHMLHYKHRTSARIWIIHGYITMSHFSCFATIGCELFQTFQNNLQKRKGYCNGQKQSL